MIRQAVLVWVIGNCPLVLDIRASHLSEPLCNAVSLQSSNRNASTPRRGNCHVSGLFRKLTEIWSPSIKVSVRSSTRLYEMMCVKLFFLNSFFFFFLQGHKVLIIYSGKKEREKKKTIIIIIIHFEGITGSSIQEIPQYGSAIDMIASVTAIGPLLYWNFSSYHH